MLLLFGIGALAVVGYGIDRVETTYFRENWEFPVFIGLMMALFGLYFFFVVQKKYRPPLRQIITVGIVLRLVLMGASPNLSDDYFRFAWDGRLWASGENPYLILPDSFLHASPETVNALELKGPVFNGLNSKPYYTVYPPVNQLVFVAGAWLGGNSLSENVGVMRLFIFLSECGVFWLLLLLLRHFKRDDTDLLIYAFNPLVIIELTGNLHFEGMMVLLLLLAVWLIVQKKWWWATLALAGSIGMKLLPLIFMPLWIKRLGWKKTIWMGLGVGALCVAMFLPFFSMELVGKLGSSLDLYFRRFEFNASIYYILRAIGESVKGYNPIAFIGPASGIAVLLGVCAIAWKEKREQWLGFFTSGLFVLTLYFGFATIVHPWYLVTLVAFSVLSTYRFALVWSAMVVLTYYKYINPQYPEPYVFIGMEYLVVGAILGYELYRNKRNRTIA